MSQKKIHINCVVHAFLSVEIPIIPIVGWWIHFHLVPYWVKYRNSQLYKLFTACPRDCAVKRSRTSPRVEDQILGTAASCKLWRSLWSQNPKTNMFSTYMFLHLHSWSGCVSTRHSIIAIPKRPPLLRQSVKSIHFVLTTINKHMLANKTSPWGVHKLTS